MSKDYNITMFAITFMPVFAIGSIAIFVLFNNFIGLASPTKTYNNCAITSVATDSSRMNKVSTSCGNFEAQANLLNADSINKRYNLDVQAGEIVKVNAPTTGESHN